MDGDWQQHRLNLGTAGHQRGYAGASDDWLTPPHIIEVLGLFDLDPCASRDQPWSTATEMLAPPRDGLLEPWTGRVWLNPPYGPAVYRWLDKLATHGSGIALVFARTETVGFRSAVWKKASSLLFIAGRLTFRYPVSGDKARANAGAGSVLVAYSDLDTQALGASGIPGSLVTAWETT